MSTPAQKPDDKRSDDRLGERSASICERQRARFEGSSGTVANADMGPAEVREHCLVDEVRALARGAGTCCGRPCSSST